MPICTSPCNARDIIAVNINPVTPISLLTSSNGKDSHLSCLVSSISAAAGKRDRVVHLAQAVWLCEQDPRERGSSTAPSPIIASIGHPARSCIVQSLYGVRVVVLPK
jgi:hypothetical protein